MKIEPCKIDLISYENREELSRQIQEICFKNDTPWINGDTKVDVRPLFLAIHACDLWGIGWVSETEYRELDLPVITPQEFISRYSTPVGDGVTDDAIAIQQSEVALPPSGDLSNGELYERHTAIHKPSTHVIHVDYVMDGATAEYLINNGYDIVVEPGGCIDYSTANAKPDQDDRPLSAREQAWLDKQNQPPAPEPEREANIPDLPDNTFDPRLGWLR